MVRVLLRCITHLLPLFLPCRLHSEGYHPLRLENVPFYPALPVLSPLLAQGHFELTLPAPKGGKCRGFTGHCRYFWRDVKWQMLFEAMSRMVAAQSCSVPWCLKTSAQSSWSCSAHLSVYLPRNIQGSTPWRWTCSAKTILSSTTIFPGTSLVTLCSQKGH